MSLLSISLAHHGVLEPRNTSVLHLNQRAWLESFPSFSAKIFATGILSNGVHLQLDAPPYHPKTDDIEFLYLLRQFSAVQSLYVRTSAACKENVALTLEDITREMVTEVLLSLNLIYLAGPVSILCLEVRRCPRALCSPCNRRRRTSGF